MDLNCYIKTKAIELGFDLVGITTAEPVDRAARQHFQTWLDEGKAAGMTYLYRNIDKRFDPCQLLPGAKSVICAAIKYAPLFQASAADCRIASFALYEDYHKVLKETLLLLAKYIQTLNLKQFDYKVCVDSVPLAERALSKRAGLGFIARNGMLINPQLGNCILLGEIITTLELEPDKPLDVSGCANCRRCVEACPTHALGTDGHLDASRCLSYLTIEAPLKNSPPAKGEYAERVRGLNYVFGCDECLKACPYSACNAGASNPLLKPHPEWLGLTRQQIMGMTDLQFETFFAGSGLLRLGLERLQRNCHAAWGAE